MSARRAEEPHVVAVLENFPASGRTARLADQLTVVEEIRVVGRDVDGDHDASRRRVGREAFDVAMKLPPMTLRVSRSAEDCGEQSCRQEGNSRCPSHLLITLRDRRQNRWVALAIPL